MGTKSRQILRNLKQNQQYFIDLFGVHTTLNNLSFTLRSTNIWFNRSDPIVIADGKIVTAKLSEFGRQLVFSFRVKNYHRAVLFGYIIRSTTFTGTSKKSHRNRTSESITVRNYAYDQSFQAKTFENYSKYF